MEVVPEQGGRVRSLNLFGREWLLDDNIVPGRTDSLMARGGWDECAPAAVAGAMPDWVKGSGGRPNPEGGEARSQHPETIISTDEGVHRVTCTWRGKSMPWQLTRTLLVRQDGAVEARYEALTTGSRRLPFLWSANLVFPLTGDTRLKLPDGGRVRIEAVKGAKPLGEVNDSGGVWPRLTLNGKPRDLSRPWSVPRKTFFSGWLDLGSGRTMIQLMQGEECLTLTCDGAGVPYCGLVIDRRGHETGGVRRLLFSRWRTGAPAIALRPSLGAPGRFADALGDWQAITWLAPGEPRRWTLTLRGGA